jgi:signal transduction histidine kinase
MAARGSSALILAFAALLGVSAIAAFAVWRNTRQAQDQTFALHDRDLQTHEALAEIRSGVYLTAILTRDYLLDPDPAHVREYSDQLQMIERNARNMLGQLERKAQGDTQRSALGELRSELKAYWGTTQLMLEWTPQEKRQQRTTMLRQRGQRRMDIFALTERIEQLITESSAQERQRMTSSDRDFRSSLGWIALAALLLGLGISGFTWFRMRALENQSTSAERELRMLSNDLRTAQEQERKSLSRELHDQVGQMLTGLRMELAAVSRLHAAPDSEISARLARAKETVEQTLGIVRNIAMLLRPSMLDDLGLAPAINWLVKEVSRTSGIAIRTDVDPRVDELPDAHRTCLYRVVQEALTNATRHSGARSIEVHVATDGDWVEAVISDDGRGIPATDKRRSLGLLGMEERVRELGGSFHLESEPGRGTAVEVRLPRPTPAEEKEDDSNLDRRRSRDRAHRVKVAP